MAELSTSGKPCEISSISSPNEERAGVRSFNFDNEPLTLTLSPLGRGEGNCINDTISIYV